MQLIKSFFQDVVVLTFAFTGVASFGVLLIKVLEARLNVRHGMDSEFLWFTATLVGFLAGGFLSLVYWIDHL
jgi:hypothetical protein